MPNRFLPINNGASFSEALPAINGNFAQLDAESVTKVFKQSAGNAIIEGKLPYDGGYGNLYYGLTGIPGILIGIAPDGILDICAAIDGQDVTQLYS